MKQTVAQSMGRFVHGLTYGSLPEEVVEKAKTCMINGIGIGMAGHDIPSAKIAREIVLAEEAGTAGHRSATLFCHGAKVSVMGAAFANACLFHGRCQEDTLGTTHPGTVIIPAALALAEREGSSGKELIESIVAGYEVVGALDREVSSYTTPRGFRASPIFGIFGSASAAAKLLKLSEEETVHAIGFAGAFAGGTLESFAAGTMEWRFEVGVASREGMMAAFIARNGGKTAPTAVEGNAGFLRAFADRADMAERIPARLGKKWEIMNVGFKPHPVCAANQSPIISMIDLVRETGLQAEDILRIRIRVNPREYGYPGLNCRGPFRTVGATLMSTPFCLALACVEKDVTLQGLGQFTNPEILGLVELIEHIPDEQIPAFSCVIDVETKTGKTFVKKTIISPDYYNFELSQVVKTVNKAISETGVAPSRVQEFIELVENLQDAGNIQALVETLSPGP